MSHVSSHGIEELSDAERAFYSRQLILPEMGYEAQLALKGARVVVLGAGGLGAPSLLYLAGAGVGHIVVIDDDRVDTSNLHRQVIHTYARVGNSKAESAAESLRALNPHIRVDAVCLMVAITLSRATWCRMRRLELVFLTCGLPFLVLTLS